VDSQLVSALLDFGGIGLLAGFLIWQHVGMQRRLDALVASFQEQIEKVNANYDDRIEKMRERYDAVIEGIRTECKGEVDRITDQRDSIQAELAILIQDTNRKIDSLLRD
jgi:phage host-nuclease inhibitor protein Gam